VSQFYRYPNMDVILGLYGCLLKVRTAMMVDIYVVNQSFYVLMTNQFKMVKYNTYHGKICFNV